MTDSERRLSFGLAACTIAGSSAALCEWLRAVASNEPLSGVYAGWCVILVIAGSQLLGFANAPLSRAFPSLVFVLWLAGAGWLAHGSLGAVGFAVAGLSLGGLARTARPAIVPWAVSVGCLFEASGMHATRFTSLVEKGAVSLAHLELAQHVVGFTIGGLLITWLLRQGRVRTASVPATVTLLAVFALFSVRNLAFGKPDPTLEQRSRNALAGPRTEGPNVLLVVLDTVRADHTSVYGYARETTPQLARLLASRPGAQRFASAYANASWTVPAHASLLSGQLPSVHGADFAGLESGEPLAVGIAREVPMLAELIGKQGWATLAVFANRWLRTAQGFRRGFEVFERVEPRIEMDPLGERLRGLFFPRLRAGEMASFATADLVSARLLARLDQLDSARFFGLVNFMDAHGPHAAMPKFAGKFGSWSVFQPLKKVMLDNPKTVNQQLMARYDEQIAFLDQEIGRLFDKLEERGILDRTWVIVTADHGEAFGEHGVTDHGCGVFDEIVHVPLLIFPPRGAALAAQDRPVAQIDVAATIAAIAGVRYDGPGRDLRRVDGESLVQIQHGAEPFRVKLCGELAGKDARAVIRGKWKLLEIAESRQLFDLELDPGETRDVAADFPEVVSSLSAQLPERMLHPTPVAPHRAPDAAERRRLRQLGY